MAKSLERVVVVQATEFHSHGRAVVVDRQPDDLPAAMPNLDKDALKRRLKDVINTMRRLAREKDSGSDLAAALSRLQAKTFSAKLAELAGMPRGTGGGVTDADLDRMEATLSWLERFVEEGTRRLILDWARGERWDAMVVVYEASKMTLWRRIDRALNDILCGLRAESINRLIR